jgi:hypothetical protein
MLFSRSASLRTGSATSPRNTATPVGVADGWSCGAAAEWNRS